MAGYYERLDLWCQRVWKLQGFGHDPDSRVLRHRGKEMVLTNGVRASPVPARPPSHRESSSRFCLEAIRSNRNGTDESKGSASANGYVRFRYGGEPVGGAANSPHDLDLSPQPAQGSSRHGRTSKPLVDERRNATELFLSQPGRRNSSSLPSGPPLGC